MVCHHKNGIDTKVFSSVSPQFLQKFYSYCKIPRCTVCIDCSGAESTQREICTSRKLQRSELDRCQYHQPLTMVILNFDHVLQLPSPKTAQTKWLWVSLVSFNSTERSDEPTKALITQTLRINECLLLFYTRRNISPPHSVILDSKPESREI